MAELPQCLNGDQERRCVVVHAGCDNNSTPGNGGARLIPRMLMLVSRHLFKEWNGRAFYIPDHG